MGTAGVAAAQSGKDYTVHMIVAGSEDFANDYTGLFVFVEQQSTFELDAAVIDGCDFDATWDPEELNAFNGRLVDQIEGDAKHIATQIFTKADSSIEEGALYVINRTYSCPDDYVGLGVNEIRSEDLATETGTPEPDVTPITEDVTGTETTDGDGPGFGVAGAVAGVGGLAGLARLLRSDGEE